MLDHVPSVHWLGEEPVLVEKWNIRVWLVTKLYQLVDLHARNLWAVPSINVKSAAIRALATVLAGLCSPRLATVEA